MKKTLFIATFFVVAAIFSYGIRGYVQKNEVLRTGIKYFFDDIATRHSEDGLLIGSSSIRYMDQSKYLHCGIWLNRGIGNADIPALRRYLLFSPLSISPKRIVVYTGENDVRRGASPEKTVYDYIRFLSMLRDKYPESELHVIAIKPSPARKQHWDAFYRVNNSIETHISKMENTFFHPADWAEVFYDSPLIFKNDGVHLADEGYRVLVKGINELCQ